MTHLAKEMIPHLLFLGAAAWPPEETSFVFFKGLDKHLSFAMQLESKFLNKF
jgi:hypothetical protein